MVEVVQSYDRNGDDGWAVVVCGKQMFWYKERQLAIDFAHDLKHDFQFREIVRKTAQKYAGWFHRTGVQL